MQPRTFWTSWYETSAKYLTAYLMLRLGMAALQVSTLLLCIIPVFGQLTQLSLQVALLHTPLQRQYSSVSMS